MRSKYMYKKPKSTKKIVPKATSRIDEYRRQSSEEQSEAFSKYSEERKNILQSDLPQSEKSQLVSELVSRYNRQVVEIQERYRALING